MLTPLLHGCFCHLTQSNWRKIQNLGLVKRYHEDEDVELFCGMIDSLTFVPESDVPDGMAYLHDNIPNGLEPLLQYFDGMCVSGSYCQIQLPQ